MKNASSIIGSKKWQIDSETEQRLTSLVDKFVSQQSDTKLLDIQQFSSYFVTHVYKLVCSKNGHAENYYAKFAYLPKGHEVRQRERIKYEYDYTMQISQLFNTCEQFDSVKAVAFYQEESAFVMAEMIGERLDKMLVECMKPFLKGDTAKLYESMNMAGKWLKEFQIRMPVIGEKFYTTEQLEERVITALEKIKNNDQFLISEDLSKQLLKRTAEILADFSQKDLTITAKHNDYAPWNVMHSNKGIIGFDYADIEYDSRFYDVYHFTRALNSFKLKPVKNVKVIEECKSQFLDGYGLEIPVNHPTRVYFNIFFSLERTLMLLRARKRNSGIVGALKTVSQRRHLKRYLAELKRVAK